MQPALAQMPHVLAEPDKCQEQHLSGVVTLFTMQESNFLQSGGAITLPPVEMPLLGICTPTALTAIGTAGGRPVVSAGLAIEGFAIGGFFGTLGVRDFAVGDFAVDGFAARYGGSFALALSSMLSLVIIELMGPSFAVSSASDSCTPWSVDEATLSFAAGWPVDETVPVDEAAPSFAAGWSVDETVSSSAAGWSVEEAMSSSNAGWPVGEDVSSSIACWSVDEAVSFVSGAPVDDVAPSAAASLFVAVSWTPG